MVAKHTPRIPHGLRMLSARWSLHATVAVLAFSGACLLLLHLRPAAGATAHLQQGIQAEVSTQVSWGSANGCEQNIATNDFGALTPSATATTRSPFGALPAADASTDSSGQKVWVGCVTTNATLASVSARGTAEMRSANDSLPLSNVSIGVTNAIGEQIDGGSARCTILAGQSAPDACTLPQGGAGQTLLRDADAGTTELDWQYQLNLPANQPVGTYTGGQVTFTATAEESATVEPAGTVTEYLLPPGGTAYGITAGPDGNLWYTDDGLDKIGKITTSGVITEYTLPSGSVPREIAAGSDGDLWFTDTGSSRIGKITTSGAITEYPLPAGSKPEGITAGPDGDMWYAAGATSKIGKITPSGTITEYALPGEGTPYGITAGPDGDVWFTEWLVSTVTASVGKITPSGAVTEYRLLESSLPYIITAGPDGNLWFANFDRETIEKITTSGEMTEYGVPAGSGPYGVAADSDGNLWFTERLTSVVAKITPGGKITEYKLRLSNSDPYTIAAGPDGDMWFAEDTAGRLAKITP